MFALYPWYTLAKYLHLNFMRLFSRQFHLKKNHLGNFMWWRIFHDGSLDFTPFKDKLCSTEFYINLKWSKFILEISCELHVKKFKLTWRYLSWLPQVFVLFPNIYMYFVFIYDLDETQNLFHCFRHFKWNKLSKQKFRVRGGRKKVNNICRHGRYIKIPRSGVEIGLSYLFLHPRVWFSYPSWIVHCTYIW